MRIDCDLFRVICCYACLLAHLFVCHFISYYSLKHLFSNVIRFDGTDEQIHIEQHFSISKFFSFQLLELELYNKRRRHQQTVSIAIKIK